MKNKSLYNFENNILKYESYLHGFSPEIFEKFDLISKELKLNSKINDLLEGNIVNQSEDRAAWHPKYRRNGPKNSYKVLEKCINKLLNKTDLKDGDIKKINIFFIGIGGSYEGPKLLNQISGATFTKNFNFNFITGSDPAEFKYKTFNAIPEHSVFIICSKSFTTDETIDLLNKALKWSRNNSEFIAVTANPKKAKEHKISNIIEFDNEIGGRYSIWSQIGELSTTQDVFKDFLLGGFQSDHDLQNDESYLRFVKTLSYSDIWLNNKINKNVRSVLSYIWEFRTFSDYVQQLEMESLGKRPSEESQFTNTGQIVFGGYGPRAQHSYFQLLHQGTQDVCADIIATREDENVLSYAQAVTQAKLLSQGTEDIVQKEEKVNGNVPLNLFLINKADPYTLGYLIASWEHRTFITATMLQINPFDQFGVNAGKIYTKKYLSE